MSCADTVDRLHHVVERQAGRDDSGQRLHLDPSAVGGAGRRVDHDAVVAHIEVDGDAVQRDRVAQRHQVGGALRTGQPGDPGHRERVALRQPVAAQQRDHLGRGDEPALRVGGAHGDVLRRDVDHAGRAALVQVGQFHDTEGSQRGAAGPFPVKFPI